MELLLRFLTWELMTSKRYENRIRHLAVSDPNMEGYALRPALAWATGSPGNRQTHPSSQQEFQMWSPRPGM